MSDYFVLYMAYGWAYRLNLANQNLMIFYFSKVATLKLKKSKLHIWVRKLIAIFRAITLCEQSQKFRLRQK